ncbi:MAG: VWA domain-containing protein, partial [Acidiferrobacterales bacterium]|nr:VWA domain-containing protein [Acidiferrobacterales bacterium]
MNWDLSQFHFIRPLWLGLLPVMLLLWWYARGGANNGEWESYLPKPMLEALRVSAGKKSSYWQWWLLIAWVLLTLAAAGPSWIKQPVPVVENKKALVIAFDLSPSMLADDVTPNRLTLAKYKLIDILRQQADGQVALIAYAGDAHTVSPLTDDPRTIEALLPALHPNIMPVNGSNTEAAVELAQNLLRDARVSSGDILLITDGVSPRAIKTIESELNSANSLSVLGVGGVGGAPIKLQDGGFLRDRQGEIVLASLNANELRAFARNLRGRYASLSTNDSDIDYLLKQSFESDGSDQVSEGETSFDHWLDMAHYLVLLLLPIALFCFRKGLIYLVPICFLMPLESEAASWVDLWKTKDQQAAELYDQEQYDEAAQTFKREDWSAISHYRNGDFEQAAEQLEGKGDANSLYNKANSLAFLGELEKAIDAYDQVLALEPEHQDALHNKQVLEALLEQQQEQNGEGDNSDQEQQSGDQQQDSQQQGNQSQENQPSQSENQDTQESDSQQNQSSSDENQGSEGEPSAQEEPSAEQEPSAQEEPSAGEETPSDEQS